MPYKIHGKNEKDIQLIINKKDQYQAGGGKNSDCE